MDILSFKELLKAYNAGRCLFLRYLNRGPEVLCKPENTVTMIQTLRDLDYYEQNVGGTVNA